jgi:hypothetical protein
MGHSGTRADERLRTACRREQRQSARIQTDTRMRERLAGLHIFTTKPDVGRAVLFQDPDAVALAFDMFLHNDTQPPAWEGGSCGHAHGLAGLERTRLPIGGMERIHNLKDFSRFGGQNGVSVPSRAVKWRQIFRGANGFPQNAAKGFSEWRADGGQGLTARTDFGHRFVKRRHGRTRPGRGRSILQVGRFGDWNRAAFPNRDILFKAIQEFAQQGDGFRAMEGGDTDVNCRVTCLHDPDPMNDHGSQTLVALRD